MIDIKKSFDIAFKIRNMSKKELAKRSEKTQAYISQVTTKKNLNISIGVMQNLVEALGYKFTEFIDLTEKYDLVKAGDRTIVTNNKNPNNEYSKYHSRELKDIKEKIAIYNEKINSESLYRSEKNRLIVKVEQLTKTDLLLRLNS